MDDGLAVAIEDVTKRYATVTAVEHLSLQVPRGSVFGLLGPNGAGKTTTLRMILGIILPDHGRIRVLGEPLGDVLRDRMGYLPEERGLYPRMPVQDVLVFLGSLKGLSEAEARRRTADWLRRLELTEWAKRRVQELSKGMQQKVQFIAAVLHEPPVLILDEPFMGLDPVNTALVKDCMMELHRRGTTLILSTHRMEQVEMLCDAICLINYGRAMLQGSLATIKQTYGKNTLRVELATPLDGLELSSFAERISCFGRALEMRLRPAVPPERVLQYLLGRGASLTRFEVTEPSLQEIFVETVRGT